MDDVLYDHSVPRRSEGTRQDQRPQQDWPEGKSFKLLSIDGGGIRGLLPALFLEKLERRFLNGEPIGRHFDMIVGTSTGGIIALGLGSGMRASDIARVYLERGTVIFPQANLLGRCWRQIRGTVGTIYDRRVLESELRRIFQDRTFGESGVPLCIPAFEGRFSEPYIFKTPHHPDYKRDGRERMVDVALSTAVAPTNFDAVDRDGYTFIDGGIWANNPIMIGVVDALTCYKIARRQMRVLSIGTGKDRLRVDPSTKVGGRYHWARHFYKAAMAAQSHNAQGQAYLLLGKDRVTRIDGPETHDPIGMDDVKRAVRELPGVAEQMLEAKGAEINRDFLVAS